MARVWQLPRLFSKEKRDSPKIGSDFAKNGSFHNLRDEIAKNRKIGVSQQTLTAEGSVLIGEYALHKRCLERLDALASPMLTIQEWTRFIYSKASRLTSA
jgi:hypothetical protein